MSSTITNVTQTTITTHSYAVLSTTIGVIAILLLLFLLVEKEVLRAIGLFAKLRALDVAIIPLLASFLSIMAVRLLQFMR